MYRSYSTQTIPALQRPQYWQEVTSKEIFRLDARFLRADRASAEMQAWDLGDVSLIHLHSDAIRYQRQQQHLRAAAEDNVLVSFSEHSDIHFRQDGIELFCRERQFFLERPSQVSDFVQMDRNDVWILKLPLPMLKRHTRSIEPFYSSVFDCNAGVGGLLLDLIRQIPVRCGPDCAVPLHGVGNTLVELLVLATESDARAVSSTESSIQKAHLARIEKYVRRNLGDPSLNADKIAKACSISVRYIHRLFHGTGTTLSRWIREMRLEACRAQICEVNRRESLGEIAYRWGFVDQARFSRHFRAQYGTTPRDMRACALARRQDIRA